MQVCGPCSVVRTLGYKFCQYCSVLAVSSLHNCVPCFYNGRSRPVPILFSTPHELAISSPCRPQRFDESPQTELKTDKAAVEKLYNDLRMEYEATYGNDIGLQKAVQKWLNLLPPGARVLDCGPGTSKPVAKMIVDSGRHVQGIDLSPRMISLCRQVPAGTFQVMDMLDFRPTVEYDGIVASLSLFELDRQQLTSVPAKCFQWMKPGGFLLIATVSTEDCEGQTDPEHWHRDGEYARVEWKFMGRDVVVSLFTRAGWKTHLGDAGFEISHTESDLFVAAGAVSVDEARYYIIAKKPSHAENMGSVGKRP